MKIADMTWMKVEAYLRGDDRAVLPLGSTEQHAYLSLATDATLAERVALDAAEPLGVPVFPVLPYGISPYFMGFPGTVTLTPGTYERVLEEILGALHTHGFRRIFIVNGHGGNGAGRPAAEAWAEARPDVQLLWHDWWKAPNTMARAKMIDADASHASWMEGFPWTRVEGAAPPAGRKSPVDLAGRDALTPAQFRARIGDGSFGGYYRRPDQELLALWDEGVRETRELLDRGWAR